jgi:hypothetical protein
MIRITVLGRDRVQRAIDKRKAPALTFAAQKALHLGGAAAVPCIRAEAPRFTGATAESVAMEQTGTRVAIGPHTDYAHFPIRGTRRGVEPNPWVARGARAARPAARTAFTMSVRNDIK